MAEKSRATRERLMELSPEQLASTELAAQRQLPQAVVESGAAVVAWMVRYVEKGLSPRTCARIMLGRKLKAERKQAKIDRARTRKPVPSPYGNEPGDRDYSGEIRR